MGDNSLPNIQRMGANSLFPAEKPVVKKGLLILGIAGSVGVSQIVGALSGAVATVGLMWEKAKLFASHHISSRAEHTFQRLDGERNDEVLISTLRGALSDEAIASKKHIIVASLFSLVPFLGVRLVGNYLLRKEASEGEKAGMTPEGYALGRALGRTLGKRLQQTLFYPRSSFLAKPFVVKALDNNKCTVERISVDRGDGKDHAIEAYIRKKIDPKKPTVVLFHANMQTAADVLDEKVNDYPSEYNVVAVTMGGYPASDAGVNTSEISSYQDANAIMSYLKEKGVTTVIAHGLSVGGTLAFAAAELYPDMVKCVVADQTMASARDVASNLITNLVGGIVPGSILRAAVSEAFPSGRIVPGVYTADKKPYTTDGLDNRRKASAVKCDIIAIKATGDSMMGRSKQKDGSYARNFADDIMEARYGTGGASRSLEVQGEHCERNGSDSGDFLKRLKNILSPQVKKTKVRKR